MTEGPPHRSDPQKRPRHPREQTPATAPRHESQAIPESSLPFGVAAKLAGTGGHVAWLVIDDLAHALRTRGREVALAHPGRPPREQTLVALRAMQQALDGWAAVIAQGAGPDG